MTISFPCSPADQYTLIISKYARLAANPSKTNDKNELKQDGPAAFWANQLHHSSDAKHRKKLLIAESLFSHHTHPY